MPICSFCKKNYNFPKGLTIYATDGRIIYFCSSKCRKNNDLKRDPKKTSWVKKRSDMKKTLKQKVLAK